MRYLASISYDGSSLYGFQKLKGKKTVQGELERVLSHISKKKVVVKGAGRTDRYVHAINQKAHFDLDVNITPSHLKKAMNSLLDSSIYINNIEIVDDNFHARFNVKKKYYEYIINVGEYSPLIDTHIYNYNHPLNVKQMKKASKYLLGIHSFEAFVSGKRENYVSIIYNIKITKKNNLVVFNFVGKSFYRYMIRNIVGGLILVGNNNISLKQFKDMLDSNTNKYNYVTVPACGLYLKDVEY